MNTSNYLLQAKSNHFFWQGDGQLSIKTFSNGKAYYKTTQGYFAVEESRYLLLNKGSYSITIENDREVESFCLFFKDGFAEEVANTFDIATDTLLSDPFKPVERIGFFEKTYDRNPVLSAQITYLKQKIPLLGKDPLWLDEQYYKIMQTVLHIHRKTVRDVHSIKALLPTTREEIYRRISIAHDFIRAFYDRPLKLSEIARIACLSPNHLLRSYVDVFSKTPHQHITEFRLSRAKQLLGNPDYSLTDIAFAIGFQQLASFSKMFKIYTGISPMQFRKKVILEKKSN
ncbi:AraC family transcriptional regulator [Bacillus gobiensis]|uniref:helix-turn-helix domain-containing protein n=1 Tax=Bacillus gobiensis TaxID=1441095 RepID=UPI003D24158B